MVIDKFKGEYAFLSNFYPVRVIFQGATYPSVENAYQAAKTLDREDRIPFEECSAKESKKLGKQLKLRSDWDSEKIAIMRLLVCQKFTIPNYALHNKLLDTYPAELVEGNYWGDTFWGVCRGKGQNHLGIILMELRNELYAQRELSQRS